LEVRQKQVNRAGRQEWTKFERKDEKGKKKSSAKQKKIRETVSVGSSKNRGTTGAGKRRDGGKYRIFRKNGLS